jgi:hypothetical protein
MAETVHDHPVMTISAALEARLLAIETALHEIQCRLATLPCAPNWLDEIRGSCKDEPAFEEVMALGRACRASQPYPDEPGAAACARAEKPTAHPTPTRSV